MRQIQIQNLTYKFSCQKNIQQQYGGEGEGGDAEMDPTLLLVL